MGCTDREYSVSTEGSRQCWTWKSSLCTPCLGGDFWKGMRGRVEVQAIKGRSSEGHHLEDFLNSGRLAQWLPNQVHCQNAPWVMFENTDSWAPLFGAVQECGLLPVTMNQVWPPPTCRFRAPGPLARGAYPLLWVNSTCSCSSSVCCAPALAPCPRTVPARGLCPVPSGA